MRTESLKNESFTRLFARKPLNFTLRMAPMIDIIFLLLIFFMVCAKWKPAEQFLPLQLPTANAAEMSLVITEPLCIYITAEDYGCDVQIAQTSRIQIRKNSVEKDLAEVIKHLEHCLTAQHRFAGDPVEIICAAEVKWDYLAKIYNVLYGAGLTDITFALTESP
jgi:biopolymer transport protein ExbD